jgi:hypothetical protein
MRFTPILEEFELPYEFEKDLLEACKKNKIFTKRKRR